MLAQLSYAWWLFIVLGDATGKISCSLGLGCGTVVVPVLVLVCHFGQKSAQGMALAVMVPMAFVGVVRYWRLGIDMNFLVSEDQSISFLRSLFSAPMTERESGDKEVSGQPI